MDVLKVLLADDHALFRSGVAGLLQRRDDFDVVGEAQDGEEAIAKAEELMPDVILMDIYMPRCDGLQATRRIKEILPHTKIVILTVSEEDHTLFEAIKSGAHGYLLKNIEPHDLFDMLRGVSQGEAPISRATAAKILDELAKRGQEAPASSQLKDRLTQREREVLTFLTRGATNKEIASSLCISENTVKNHLRNILEKLHLENRVQAAAFALREGLTP